MSISALSSLCTPFVPLVVEWNVLCQFQVTESFTEIETVEGENVSVAPGPTMTLVVAGNCVKVISWYDNEWGYSSRVHDLINYLGSKGL